MRHDPYELIDAARAIVTRTRTALAVREALSGARFAGTSDGGLVTAEVDHTARVLAIRVARTAPTRSRACDLAAQTVEAFNRARDLSRAECRRMLAQAERSSR